MTQFCILREALDAVIKRLYGKGSSGNEIDARDPPGPQIVDGWAPMGKDGWPEITPELLEQIEESLATLDRTKPPDDELERGGRRRMAQRELDDAIRRGLISVVMQCADGGTRRTLHPTDWIAPGSPLKVGYEGSVGEYQDGTVGRLWVNSTELCAWLQTLEPISMPREERTRITNEKHLAWVNLAREIAKAPDCPKFRGKPNVSEVARRVRKRGKFSDCAETIRRYLHLEKSWRP